MAYRDSPSSIPRPRITSSHFRPLPEGPQHGSSIPRPLASPSSLLVSRKRPRAETVASTSPRPARQSHILQSTCLESTTLSSPRAFSASFAASPTVLPPNGIEESWLSAATCPSQAQAADHNGHSNQDLHTPRPHSTSAEPDLPTWKTSLFSTAAAVATKVWDFARNNKFFGFRAGGGTAYDMHTGLPQQFDEGIIYTSESLSLATPNQAQNGTRETTSRQFSFGAPNMPGWFHTEDQNHSQMWESTTTQTTTKMKTKMMRAYEQQSGGRQVPVAIGYWYHQKRHRPRTHLQCQPSHQYNYNHIYPAPPHELPAAPVGEAISRPLQHRLDVRVPP